MRYLQILFLSLFALVLPGQVQANPVIVVPHVTVVPHVSPVIVEPHVTVVPHAPVMVHEGPVPVARPPWVFVPVVHSRPQDAGMDSAQSAGCSVSGNIGMDSSDGWYRLTIFLCLLAALMALWPSERNRR